MKGLMGAMPPPEFFGLEPPLFLVPVFFITFSFVHIYDDAWRDLRLQAATVNRRNSM